MAKKKNEKAPFTMPPAKDSGELVIEGLRQNNLRNLNVRIPHDRITSIVGPSGSGKSSLAFDTLFAEGRWRFIESLSTYTRMFIERMDRPDLDSIRNVRPAIAVEQKNPVRTSRSTVGTATELSDYLRLIFARIGRVWCNACGAAVSSSSPTSAADRLIAGHSNRPALIGFDLRVSSKDLAAIASELIAKGYIRVKAGDSVIDITHEALPEPLPTTLFVIADRLFIKEGERARLVDSLEISFREGAGSAVADIDGQRTIFSTELSCHGCGAKVVMPTPFSLSFNHPVGACAECKGFGNLLRYDEDKVVPDKTISLRQGAIEPWTKPAYTWWYEEMSDHAIEAGIDLDKPFNALTAEERRLLYKGTSDFEGIEGFYKYLESKKYKLHIKVFSSRYKGQVRCLACDGTRLKKEALAVTLGGLNIAEASALSMDEALSFFSGLDLTEFEKKISGEVLRQIIVKLEFLNNTGLGYITLDRLTKTLSGGEAQRVAIATQLASSLCGVLYILDEPSIGLHPVDIDMLIDQLRRLASMGNTVVTVEHEPSVIKASDHILELGPGAGSRGGRLVFSGTMDEFRSSGTLTANYLYGKEAIQVPRWRRNGSGRFLTLLGASGNNLRSVDMKIPLKAMTCVTGVSGSGKSTLIVDTLYRVLAAHFGIKSDPPGPYSSFEGTGYISGVNMVDQSPIGRTPRSNPLTYIGGFDYIRRLYASLNSSRAMGLAPGDFSFNLKGGRCEECKGEGVKMLEMYFMPDVYIKCAACGGKRYKNHVLNARFKGKSIYECLEMTFEEAANWLPAGHELQKRFATLIDIGLGYLRLGQSATTLSGGEAQRLKIARELAEGIGGDMLYILDEPTTGLHIDDIKRLLSVLGRLVDSGNTVIMIEHNMECAKTADHIIDLGPGGGKKGGTIVGSGTPERVAAIKGSLTGKYLKQALSRPI
ncbi:MAG: excinuclease ABC subunit UvrA [Deltaproteobacteria bacterium]